MIIFVQQNNTKNFKKKKRKKKISKPNLEPCGTPKSIGATKGKQPSQKLLKFDKNVLNNKKNNSFNLCP